MLVYVVGYQPANDRAAVGGFDWYYVEPAGRELAVGQVTELLRHGDDHSVTFVPLEVPDELDADAITAWIDGNLHLVEVGR